jgi:hypothetical protein
MHKLIPLIEKVILNSFPDVMEVDFKKVRVYLGSSTIERIEIIVTINNLENEYAWYQLSNLKNQIIEKVESYFNFDWREYGSKWGFEFYQARKEKL